MIPPPGGAPSVRLRKARDNDQPAIAGPRPDRTAERGEGSGRNLRRILGISWSAACKPTSPMSVHAPDHDAARSLLRDCIRIVVTGALLGVAFNQAGLGSRPARGLPWIASAAPLESLEGAGVVVEEASRPSARTAPSGASLGASGSPAVPSAGVESPLPRSEPSEPAEVRADLPSIPEVGRPLEVKIATVAKFVEAEAALIVDARDRGAFADGHIPGAVNLPYEEATRDLGALRALDPRGRPVIVYCSGGDCEASRMLAELLTSEIGLRRVLVYEAGFPEWAASGMKVDR